jgi:hypothetical protein
MRAEVAEREFPRGVCCCVEKAALHIEVVTVEIEQEERGRRVKTTREVGWFRQVRRVTLCVCFICCLPIVVIFHSLIVSTSIGHREQSMHAVIESRAGLLCS